MKTAKSSPWILGAAFVAVLILVLAWVVGIGPQMDAAAQARDDAASVRTQNTVHAQRLAELQEQFENLDEFKAELAAIRVQIPADDQEPAFIREVQAGVVSAAVFLVSMVSDVPETVAPQATTEPAPAAPAPAEGEAAAGGAEAATPAPTTETPTAETPTAVPSVPGFVAVPFTITVLGPFANSMAFIDTAQTLFQRLFLVTQVSLTGQSPTPATGGRPEVVLGDYETVVSGYIFVLEEVEQEVATETSATDPATDGVVNS